MRTIDYFLFIYLSVVDCVVVVSTKFCFHIDPPRVWLAATNEQCTVRTTNKTMETRRLRHPRQQKLNHE